MLKTVPQKFQFHLLYILLVLSLILRNVADQNDAKVVFMKVECRNLSSKVKTVNCFSISQNNRSTLTAQWVYTEEMKTVTAKFNMMLMLHGQHTDDLYMMDLDFCKALPNNSRRSVKKMLYKSLSQASMNFPSKCPFKKDVMYGIVNFEMDPDMLPTFIPELNFTATIDVFGINKEPLVSLRIVATLCKNQAYCQKLL